MIRAYIEHRLDQRPGVQKLYYIGPMFRRERPQKGRYRQFYQIGAEAIGSESPAVDAEVIEMVVEILKGVGLSGFQLLINSVGDANCRPQYVERLRQELQAVAPQMCGDCQRRAETNPLRVLDCKVEADQPIIEKLPPITRLPVRRLPRALRSGEAVPGGPRNRIRGAAAAGARPGLLHAHDVRSGARIARRAEFGAGRRPLRRPGGVARLESARAGHRVFDRRRPAGDDRWKATSRRTALDLFIAPLGEAALRHAAVMARDFRRAGLSVELAEGKLKRSMELANKLGARFTLIVGDNEMAAGRYALKNMTTGEQKELTRDEIAAALASTLN